MKYLDKNGLSIILEQIKKWLGNKVDAIQGKGLSTNDYTTAEKTKLSNIEEGANKYTLPKASTSVLGGVIVGSNLSVDSNGKLNASNTKPDYTLTTLMTERTVSANTSYTLSQAYSNFYFIVVRLHGPFSGAGVLIIPTALLATGRIYTIEFRTNATSTHSASFKFTAAQIMETATLDGSTATELNLSVYGLCKK